MWPCRHFHLKLQIGVHALELCKGFQSQNWMTSVESTPTVGAGIVISPITGLESNESFCSHGFSWTVRLAARASLAIWKPSACVIPGCLSFLSWDCGSAGHSLLHPQAYLQAFEVPNHKLAAWAPLPFLSRDLSVLGPFPLHTSHNARHLEHCFLGLAT